MTGCTGGWCIAREKCGAYLSGRASADVRLCDKGKEAPRAVVRIVTIKSKK